MKILVTGGAGFIGSNFILNQINNHKILNYDKLTYAGNLDNLISLKNNKNYFFVKGDINDRNKIDKKINDFKPDCIINFAAESHVDRSIDDPISFIDSNVKGTVNLLQASHNYINSNKSKDFKLIHISTDEVYGQLGEEGYFNEKTPFNPRSPYSASKASSDHFVNSWIKTFNFPAMIIHASNNFGPFQFPEKLIPHMILRCLNHESLPIYGDGSNIRDWLYVKDFCRAINLVINKGEIGEVYNVGGDSEKTNLQIVHLICEMMDDLNSSESLSSYKDLITFVDDRPGHDFRYAIDSTKIKRELGFKTNNKFEFYLKHTISWYLKNNSWTNNILNGNYRLKRLGINK